MSFLFNFLRILSEVLTLAIFLRAVFFWVSLGPNNILISILYHITEPLLAPLRRIIPRVGVLDFTPFIAIVILQVIRYIVF